MKNRTKLAAWALSAAIAIGLVVAPFSVGASEEGRRNTAYALGAATLYFTLKKRPVEAIVAGGATAYAAKLLQDDINRRHRREKAAAVNAARYNGSSSSYSYSSGVRSYRSSGGRTRYVSGPAYRSSGNSKALLSQAYKKGMAEGYEQGVSDGYRKGLAMGRSQAVRPIDNRSNGASDLYSRVLLARN